MPAPQVLRRIALLDLTDNGVFYIAEDGSRWGPLTCEDHAPVRLDGTPNPPGQIGFKRTHAPCIVTALLLIEHFNRVQDANAGGL